MNKISEKRRVFITGGAGLIGREMTRKLLDVGHEVVCFDLGEQLASHWTFLSQLPEKGQISFEQGTLLDRVALQRHMTGCNVVIHLAAMLGVRRTEENRLGCLEVNVTGTDNVLNAAVFNRVSHIVIASSSEVYGEPSHNPITESAETKGKTVYSVSKMAAEELARGYTQLYPDLAHTVVRFFNTYGEGQIVQFVLARFVHAVLKGQNPVVFGDGQQTRGYCHVDDTTDGLMTILDNPVARNKVYNLGNSKEVFTLFDLAQKVIDTLAPDTGLEVEVLGTFNGTDRLPEREIHHRYCDSSLAKKELGFEASITIEDGIRRIAAQKKVHMDWPDRYGSK